MKITNKKEGISLIVLVVTIIVLAILAAVVITSITEVNIINQATNATKDYSQKSEEEQYMLDGYLDFFNNGGSTEGNGGASVTTGWRHTEDGKSVTNGTQTIKVGAIVGTDVIIAGTLPTLNDIDSNGTKNQWAVLGAEDGKLLLTTTNNITTSDNAVKKVRLSGSGISYTTKEVTKKDGTKVEVPIINMTSVIPQFETAIEECGITIEETVAESIRSIDVEDINRVTTYDPTNIGTSHDGGAYGKDNSNEYGNIVKYKASTAIVADNGATGTTSSTCRYPGQSGNSEFTVQSDYYYYYPGTLLTNSSGIKPTTEEWYNLLFANTSLNNTHYWLASPYVNADSSYALWGLRNVSSGNVSHRRLWYSNGGSNSASYGVRPVVSLGSGVSVTAANT